MNEPKKKSCEFGNWTLNDILTDPREELKGAHFRIPDYQRGYAWGKRQLEEFWEDLLALKRHDKSEETGPDEAESDSGEKGKRHYMGAITVEHKGDEGGHPIYEVVDGQQRLTTIAILLSVLDTPQKNDIRFRFSYGKSNGNNAFFEQILDAPLFSAVDSEDGKRTYPAPSFLPAPLNVYQKNLVDAKSFFSEKVDKLKFDTLASDCPSTDDIKAWLVGDSEKGIGLEFDFRILRHDHNAGIIFETMNNRGKPLTLLEKLKNRLMYLTESKPVVEDSEKEAEENTDEEDEIITPKSIRDDLRDEINDAWYEIYRELAADPKREPLDEDEFVAAHLSVYREPEESVYSETVAESRLFKMFSDHPERHPVSESVDESDENAMSKVKKQGKMEPPLSLEKIREYIDDLRKFSFSWAAIHREAGSACGRCRLLSGTREIKAFLAAVWDELARSSQGQPFVNDPVFIAAEKLLFRNTIRAIIDERAFATWARKLHNKKEDDAKSMSLDEVRNELEDTLKGEKRQISTDDLVEVFSDRMDRQQSPYGFYGWAGLKYFLFTRETGDFALRWDRFEETSLEHIIPQSSTADEYNGWWRPQIDQFAPRPEGVPDGEEKKKAMKEWRHSKRVLVNSLGNFVLLTQKGNASISDKPWESYKTFEVVGKKEFYIKRENDSSAGAREVAMTPEPWTAWHIRERGKILFRDLARLLTLDSQKLSDAEIYGALGFTADPTLKDKPLSPLTDADVERLLPRRGMVTQPNPAEQRKHADEAPDLKGIVESMAHYLGAEPDYHNNVIELVQLGGGKLTLRFTKDRPRVRFNFVVADKEAFSTRYGAVLTDWGEENGFHVKLGKDSKSGNKSGNGVQFRPKAYVDIACLDCEALKRMGDSIVTELQQVLG